jgi:hypothetical protein
MALGFFTDDNSGDSYESIQRKRKLADALLAQSQDGAPIQSWTQGGAKLIQALAGSLQNRSLDTKERESSKAFNETLIRALGGQSSGSMPSAATSPMPTGGAAPAPAGGSSDMAPFRNAIASIESRGSGDYNAVGPTNPRLGRALGRYQVMEANIGPWSREALGREVTPDEFLKNPQLQDAVFDHKFGQYMQKFGSPDAAAQAWFGGPGGVGQLNRRDSLGTTISAYTDKFNAALPQAGGAQVASLVGVPASAAPPQPAQGQRLAQAVTSPPIPAPQPTGNVQQAMMAVLSDPRFSPQQKQQAMQMYQMTQRDEGVTTVDLGDRVALMNKRGQVIREMPKTRDGADWQLVKDENGNPVGRFNARTGTTEPINATLPQGSQKAPTTRVVKQADGSEVALQWDGKAGPEKKGAWVPLDAPQGGNPVANPKLTEGQSKDLNYALRGEDILPLLEQKDTALTEFLSANARNVPVLGNYFKTPEYRQAEQYGRELLAAILRKDTGAAVTKDEMELYSGMYLPQPGDDQTTIEQKRAGRARAIEGIKLGIGPAKILLDQRKAVDTAAKPKKADQNATRPIQKGATATNPQTKEKIVFDGEKWVPAQ